MYDRIDEWVVSALTEFEGKPLRSVPKGDLDLARSAATPPRRGPTARRRTRSSR